MDRNEWFLSRNLRVVNYQTKAIEAVQASMNENKVTVLAASPTAGKTLMSIFMIEDYLEANPMHKVLVLAHGQTILRSQYHDTLIDCNNAKPLGFTYAMIETCNDYYLSDKQVNVCLPQTLARCKAIAPADLVIVDEAHEFYFAKTVTKIIEETGTKKQMLLTGTPSGFIEKHMPVIAVALNTVYDEGMVSDFYVELASSTHNFGLQDFNADFELRKEMKFHNKDTKKTLDDLIKQMVSYLKSIKGTSDYVNLLPKWLPTLKQLKKTMIACKSQHQAKAVQKYFETIGVKSVLSISDTDTKSEEIKKFKTEEDVLVLIVVGRGILGFNMPELVNIVDMTMSYNPDRIYQLLCRVARKHPNGDKKLFFKVAPEFLRDYYKHIMTCVLMLAEEEFLLKYNGKNFNDMVIPFKKPATPTTGEKTCTGVPIEKKPRKYETIDMDGLPVFQFFKSIYHTDGELLQVYAKTRMIDIRNEFRNGTNSHGYWTLEKLLESALKYNTIGEWEKNDNNAYCAARRFGYMSECTAHMTIINKMDWTDDEIMKSASKYNTKNDWFLYDRKALNAARRRNIYDKATAHMISGKKTKWHSKELIMEAVNQCTSIDDFTERFSGAYNSALKLGILNECTKSLRKNKQHTKESIIATAMECNGMFLGEWKIKYPSEYITARKQGYLNECLVYLKLKLKPSGYWTLELCMESALKYTTIGEWRKFDNPAAAAAYKKPEWWKKCTAHMPNHMRKK